MGHTSQRQLFQPFLLTLGGFLVNISKHLIASFVTLSFGVSCLVGCGSSFESATVAAGTSGSAIQGRVMGGQQPIIGAHIYLMQANPIVWKGPSTSLLTSTSGGTGGGQATAADTTVVGSAATPAYYVATTAPYGNFNISGDYSCTAGTQVYLIGVGGNSVGTSTSVSNSAIVQMALLGNCPSSGNFAASVPFITLNELSTVAAAYSVAGFTLDYLHIGGWGTDAQTTGLENAFRGAANIVSLGSGIAYTATPAGNGTVPQSKLNTLADIIATCVNTKANTSSACTTLFNATPSTAGVTPSTTFDAILNLAQNPTINSTNTGLISQPSAVSPFQPYLSTNPNDWTVSLKYTAPNTANPARPDYDSSGNIWIPNFSNNSLTELNTLGAVLSGKGGYTGSGLNGPASVSVNRFSDKVWAANFNSGTVSAFTAAGSAVPGSPYTTGNGSGYYVFMSGQSLIASGTNGIYQLSDAGAVTSSATNVVYNSAVTASPTGDIWSAQYANNTVASLPSGGTTATTYTGANLNAPSGISSDFNGQMWVSNVGGGASLFSYTGAVLGSYTGAGLLQPYHVRIDGYNRPWFGNSNGSVSAFNADRTAFTGTAGVTTDSTTAYNANPTATTNGFPSHAILGLIIDQAGNLWAPDYDNSLYEFLGITTPPVPVVQTLQVACGSSGITYTSSAGQTWVADANYITAGSDNTNEYTEPLFPTITFAYNNQNPAPAGVYVHERVQPDGGTFTERIPGLVAGATYNVNLHFSEIYYASAGTRQFNVAINGTTVLSNFDIYAEAGGKNIGIVRSFTATANANGVINIKYTGIAGKNNPKCTGIEIVQN